MSHHQAHTPHMSAVACNLMCCDTDEDMVDSMADNMDGCTMECCSPPAAPTLGAKYQCQLLGNARNGVISVANMDVPTPTRFFCECPSVHCQRHKITSEKGNHFIITALATHRAHSPKAGCLTLIMLGSSPHQDYTGHFLLQVRDTVKIIAAWTERLGVDVPLGEKEIAAAPLAQVIRELLGRPLHLHSALAHSNLKQTHAQRVPPMMALGCLAEYDVLCDCVSASRHMLNAVRAIQRQYRRCRDRKHARSQAGLDLMFQSLSVA